jgi:hypothetical protein
MRVCGVELKGGEAILAVIDVDVDNVIHVDLATKKIPLGDTNSVVQVKSFQEIFESFCRDNNVERICIKKRNEKGEFAGGANTFKMEGLIQVSDAPEVMLVSPQTISAMQKREEINIPPELNKYQHVAYLTGLAGRL